MSILNTLEKAGVQSHNLDSLVYEMSERNASRVNNEGMKEQLEFIEKAGLSEKEILNELNIK